MTPSQYRKKLEQKRQIIEMCLEQKVRRYQELRTDRKQSVADLGEPQELDRQSQSESGREALYEEVLNGSVQLDALAREIELLESLRSDKVFRQVQLGAIVKTDYTNFLVAVSQPRFRVEDEEYVGISMQSPFLHVAQGMVSGNSFTVANRTYLVKEVF
ncbi:MAG: hypothetical protein ICV83_13790 [Cytophagales bacterium]|nr:hypothetical protein [Cytophagales bacterium]